MPGRNFSSAGRPSSIRPLSCPARLPRESSRRGTVTTSSVRAWRAMGYVSGRSTLMESTASSLAEINKEIALTLAIQASRGPRWNMKTSTKDKLKGSFHEMKGTIKEEVGKITNARDLKAEGKAEKK